jgi:hypothetical protein
MVLPAASRSRRRHRRRAGRAWRQPLADGGLAAAHQADEHDRTGADPAPDHVGRAGRLRLDGRQDRLWGSWPQALTCGAKLTRTSRRSSRKCKPGRRAPRSLAGDLIPGPGSVRLGAVADLPEGRAGSRQANGNSVVTSAATTGRAYRPVGEGPSAPAIVALIVTRTPPSDQFAYHPGHQRSKENAEALESGAAAFRIHEQPDGGRLRRAPACRRR